MIARVAAATLSVFLGASLDALACSCVSSPFEETYGKARLVFRGELVAAAPHPTDPCGDEMLTFLPSKVWKGAISGPLLVRNGSVGRRTDGSLPGDYERVCLTCCPLRPNVKTEYIVLVFGREARLEYCHGPVEASRKEGVLLATALDSLTSAAARKPGRPTRR